MKHALKQMQYRFVVIYETLSMLRHLDSAHFEHNFSCIYKIRNKQYSDIAKKSNPFICNRGFKK